MAGERAWMGSVDCFDNVRELFRHFERELPDRKPFTLNQ